MRNKKLFIMAVMAMTASSCLAGCARKGTPEGAEKEAAKFIESVYKGDYKSIFEQMPEEFQERSLESTKTFMEEGTDEELLDYQGENLAEYVNNLETIFGEGWNMEYEVGEVQEYSKEELEELKKAYKMMGIKDSKITNAANVMTEIKFDAVNGTQGSTEVMVPLVCVNGRWHLGQYIDLQDIEMQSAYATYFGDLMDGFNIEGFFDADGNEIFYDDEGYMIMEEKDGTWTGTDEFGNIRHYDKEKNLTEVTGPDGGEPLDEGTWSDYYNQEEQREEAE